MDATKVQGLLDLIEKASVPPPNTDQDQTRYDEIVARNEAIIAKAEVEIDAELAV
ncbi:hypothetical protein LCGC14_0416680 [marine sediment metagenome]|uniref:Uncharacterized protein n=1 Tax=marine sediment metagenome TaxID=412755 RepID=A0A0F9SY30_9ZZZZ